MLIDRAVCFIVLFASAWPARADAGVEELFKNSARGAAPLSQFLRRQDAPRTVRALSARDSHGWSALAVAAYNGDVEVARLLLDAGARVEPGDIKVFMHEGEETGVPIGSLVELVVRRSSMLIMIGTHFLPPKYLRTSLKRLATSRAPSPGDPDVPDMAGVLRLLIRPGGARLTEKSREEGSDLSRAAYFIDADIVEEIVHLYKAEVDDESSAAAAVYSMSRALTATLIGISQMKHRLNRALMQQPITAGRLFRDYYGFSTGSEAELTSPEFRSMSFEDTVRVVQGKAGRIVSSLLASGANPDFYQSRQSKETALHQCAGHGLSEIAARILEAGANPNAVSAPLNQTPLHKAVVHRSAGVLSALISAGADRARTNANGRTALDLAKLLRWHTGQSILSTGASVDFLPPHGYPEVISFPELLPDGWRNHWEAGKMSPVWAQRLRGNCEIDMVRSEDLTNDIFIRDYLSLRRPLVITGGASHMPAAERWKNIRYLVRKAGSTKVSAVTIPYPEHFGDKDAKDTRSVTLEQYVKEVMGKVNSSSGTPLQVFAVVEQDDAAFKKLLNLVHRDAAPHPHWLLQNPKEKSKIRYGNIQFGIGPPGSGAPQHYHTHAYNSLFHGRKRWWFYPPPRSALSRHHSVQAAAADTLYRQRLPPEIGKESETLEQLPLVCEQESEDIMYVPTDWGHMTLNLDTVVSVARELTWDGEETETRVINSLML